MGVGAVKGLLAPRSNPPVFRLPPPRLGRAIVVDGLSSGRRGEGSRRLEHTAGMNNPGHNVARGGAVTALGEVAGWPLESLEARRASSRSVHHRSLVKHILLEG